MIEWIPWAAGIAMLAQVAVLVHLWLELRRQVHRANVWKWAVMDAMDALTFAKGVPILRAAQDRLAPGPERDDLEELIAAGHLAIKHGAEDSAHEEVTAYA